MAIEYYLVRAAMNDKKERAVMLHGPVVPFESLLDHLDDATALTRVETVGVLNMVARWIENHAGWGREVHLGPLGITRLGIKGAFDPKKKRINPDEWELSVSLQLPRVLKKHARAEAHKTGLKRGFPRSRKAGMFRVVDLGTGLNNVYTPGSFIEIRGTYLKFDPDREDEGIFLKEPGKRKTVRLDQYLKVLPKTVQARVPKGVSGSRIVVHQTRGKSKSKSPEVVELGRIERAT